MICFHYVMPAVLRLLSFCPAGMLRFVGNDSMLIRKLNCPERAAYLPLTSVFLDPLVLT